MAPLAAAQDRANTVGDTTVGAQRIPIHQPEFAPARSQWTFGTEACDFRPYDSGDPTTFGTGRTVGTSNKWEAWQPFRLDADWEICTIGLDGWYVTGSPRTFNASIYPADPNNPDLPDINSPIGGGDMPLETNGSMLHWVDLDVDNFCLENGVRYFMGARALAGADHWSAIYMVPGGGENSWSIRNGDYTTRFTANPLAMRMFGTPGCGGCVPCDMNCDEDINALDIEFFIDLLFNGTDPCCGNRGDIGSSGDVNLDGSIDAADIEGFINCLFP